MSPLFERRPMLFENFTITTYDIAFLSFFVIAILFGSLRGLFRLIAPILSFVLARIISVAVRKNFQAEAIELIMQAFKDEKILPQADRLAIGNEIFSEAVSSVAFFIATYFLIRVVLSFVFYAFKPNNRLAFHLDKLLGALVMFALAVAVTCIVVKSLSILTAVGFEQAKEITEGIDNGFFSSFIKRFCLEIYQKIPKTMF